jgi:hypothetical protein
MSQSSADSVPPPIPAAVPAQAPVPVQALPYSYSTYGQNRPSLITAIGVMSIVIACLSGLFSFFIGMYALLFFTLSKTSSPAFATATVATVSPAASSTASLSPGDAGVAVNALTPILSLDSAHIRELDYFMRSHGREALGGDEDVTLTSGMVTEAVTHSVPQSDASFAEFTTEAGTVRIYDDHSIFTSTDGGTTVRTSAKNHSESVQASNSSSSSSSVTTFQGSAYPPRSTLTRGQVATAVARVQQMATTPLTPAQIKAINLALSAPNQSLVQIGPGMQVLSVIAAPNGNVTIMFNTGNQLVVGTQGQVISSGPVPMPNFRVGTGSFAVVAGEAAGSIALAIFLLVVGIMVFRPASRPVKLLRLYALLKIPMAILAGVGLGVMGYEFIAGIASANPATSGSTMPAATGFIIYGAVICALGIAYPIALLIALRSRTVRQYYQSAAQG